MDLRIDIAEDPKGLQALCNVVNFGKEPVEFGLKKTILDSGLYKDRETESSNQV